MMRNRRRLNDILALGGSVIPLGISIITFIGILKLRLNPSVTEYFSVYSPLIFLGILVVYLVGYSIPGNLRWCVIFTFTMALLALTLSYKWGSGYSDATLIGGLLPYKDSAMYYHGSSFILLGDRIPGAEWQPAWRPIFPSFLASILFFTSGNLQLAVATLVGLLGMSLALSAIPIYKSRGALAASMYSTFLFTFIQPMVGNTLTEVHGLILGCLGFVLIWVAAKRKRIEYLLWGLVVLMVGVSSRAGTFLIFPMLIVWVGLTFRKADGFSFRSAAFSLLTVTASYVIFNPLYTKVIVGPGPGKATFGNFAYTLYGQVMGGIGWSSATKLVVKSHSEIYHIVLDEFLKNPGRFLTGMWHSYSDFFLPGDRGIFSFFSGMGEAWVNNVLWILALVLLTLGLITICRERKSNQASLLFWALIGILLSIPFLPPIDGGRRFYASTMPFFFAVAVFGLSHKCRSELPNDVSYDGFVWKIASALAASAILMSFILPGSLLFLRRNYKPDYRMSICSDGSVPFAIILNEGAFIEIVNQKSASCGFMPLICRDSFTSNGQESSNDDFYQEVVSLSSEFPDSMILLTSNDLVDGGIHFYLSGSDILRTNSFGHVVSGCADRIFTEHQSIYRIQSVQESD